MIYVRFASQAIREHSPSKPVLIFVSSRRQTRLTAFDLMAYLAGEGNPKQWLHIEESQMEQIIAGIKETNLKLSLAFGIGFHHAGLQDQDRRTVEELFVNQKIQVFIWGQSYAVINFSNSVCLHLLTAGSGSHCDFGMGCEFPSTSCGH
jgi:replicative superfamily II helicase